MIDETNLGLIMYVSQVKVKLIDGDGQGLMLKSTRCWLIVLLLA